MAGKGAQGMEDRKQRQKGGAREGPSRPRPQRPPPTRRLRCGKTAVCHIIQFLSTTPAHDYMQRCVEEGASRSKLKILLKYI